MLFKKKSKTGIPLVPGCLPSPPDGRDVLASQVSPIIKRWPEILLPPFDLDVLNQKQEPSCVGFSAAAIKQERELRERISEVFDGNWIYRKAKEIDNWSGAGTYLRVGLKILQKLGAKPLEGKEEDALRYRIGGYARVDELSFDGLKRVIAVNGAVMAGFTGSNAGWQTAYIKKPKVGEPTWGHAVILFGYNKDYLIFQNSWSENWGENGIGYIPRDYLPFEAWEVLVDRPSQFLPLEEKEGFIALGDWLGIKGLIITTKARTNFRSSPEITNNILKVLPIETKLTIQEFAGVYNGYYWLRVNV